MLNPPAEMPCRICGSSARFIGSKAGKFARTDFNLYRCPDCGLSFVGNPITDHKAVYSEDFYKGRGADPMVDYEFELYHPQETVRIYEWRGILRAVTALRGETKGCRWLDFGCGNGGLVRYLREKGAADAVGFDEGWIADRARALSIPILRPDELASHRGAFEVVTAMEVFEHLPDPVSSLRDIRSLMRPGGPAVLYDGQCASVPERAHRLALRLAGSPRQLLRAEDLASPAEPNGLSYRAPRIRPRLRGHHTVQGAEEPAPAQGGDVGEGDALAAHFPDRGRQVRGHRSSGRLGSVNARRRGSPAPRAGGLFMADQDMHLDRGEC